MQSKNDWCCVLYCRYIFVLSILVLFSSGTYAGTMNFLVADLDTQCKTYSYSSDCIDICGDSIISCFYSVNGGVKRRTLRFTSIQTGKQTKTYRSSVLINHLPMLEGDTTDVLLHITFLHGDTTLHQQMVFREPRLFVLAIGANSQPSPQYDSLHYASYDAIRVGKELDAANVNGADVTYLLAENGRSFTKQRIFGVCDSLINLSSYKASYKEPVVLYFSGHGKFDVESKTFNFFIGNDYSINNKDIINGVLSKFENGCRSLYVVIDACESQYAIQKPDYEHKFGRESKTKTVLFYAAPYNEKAKEDKDSIGTFTREFLNAIHSRKYTASAINRYMRSNYNKNTKTRTTELFIRNDNQSLDNELKEYLLVTPKIRPLLNVHYTWSPLLSHGIAASLIVNEKVPFIVGFTAAIGNKRGDGFVEESCISPTIGSVTSARYFTRVSGGIEIGYRINDYISAFVGANYVPITNVPYLCWNSKAEYVASATYPMWSIHPSAHLHLPTRSPYIKNFSFRFGYHFLISKYDGCTYSNNFADPQMFTNQLYKSFGFIEMGIGYTFNIRK